MLCKMHVKQTECNHLQMSQTEILFKKRTEKTSNLDSETFYYVVKILARLDVDGSIMFATLPLLF